MMTTLEQLAIDYVRARVTRDDAQAALLAEIREHRMRYDTRGCVLPRLDPALTKAANVAWSRLKTAVADLDNGAPELLGLCNSGELEADRDRLYAEVDRMRPVFKAIIEGRSA